MTTGYRGPVEQPEHEGTTEHSGHDPMAEEFQVPAGPSLLREDARVTRRGQVLEICLVPMHRRPTTGIRRPPLHAKNPSGATRADNHFTCRTIRTGCPFFGSLSAFGVWISSLSREAPGLFTSAAPSRMIEMIDASRDAAKTPSASMREPL